MHNRVSDYNRIKLEKNNNEISGKLPILRKLSHPSK